MNNPQNYDGWNINIEQEREFWKNYIIGTFIIIPEVCPHCKHGHIGLKNTDKINSPLEGKCNYYKCCRNINLRKNTIFSANSKTPISILYKIIRYWIVEGFNVKKIVSKLKDDYEKDNIDPRFIYTFVCKCRKAIATYMRNMYALDRLALANAQQVICVEESLFTHNEGQQQWVLGLINTATNEIRLELIANRDENTLKPIIEKHVGTGNIICSDSWAGYNFLSRANSGYVHEVSNHQIGQFGLTSRIEGIWGEIKLLIKSMYISIRSKNFIYFLKEAEYRRSIKKFNPIDKIKDFSIVLSTVGDGQYLDIEDLLDNDYDVNYDD